jgi:hypothetical protein
MSKIIIHRIIKWCIDNLKGLKEPADELFDMPRGLALCWWDKYMFKIQVQNTRNPGYMASMIRTKTLQHQAKPSTFSNKNRD